MHCKLCWLGLCVGLNNGWHHFNAVLWQAAKIFRRSPLQWHHSIGGVLGGDCRVRGRSHFFRPGLAAIFRGAHALCSQHRCLGLDGASAGRCRVWGCSHFSPGAGSSVIFSHTGRSHGSCDLFLDANQPHPDGRQVLPFQARGGLTARVTCFLILTSHAPVGARCYFFIHGLLA